MPQLVGKIVDPIGLGLMGLTWRATPCPQEQAFEAMRAAVKNGCTLANSLSLSSNPLTLVTSGNVWNGAEFYGSPDYNSLVLLERYLEKYPRDADNVIISIKGGLNPKTHKLDASAENTRRTIDDSIA